LKIRHADLKRQLFNQTMSIDDSVSVKSVSISSKRGGLKQTDDPNFIANESGDSMDGVLIF
jgi:hypothetical protein